jgi:hypothetical protein
MTDVHIYTRSLQPAHNYVDGEGIGRPFRFRSNPRRHFRASCCGKLREARYLTVQVYYDHIPFWCREGRGCHKVKP